MSDDFLPVAQPDIGALEEQLVLEAVRSGWVSSIGHFVEEFERRLSELTGAAHVAAVSNGTVALHLALVARGIGPGDEVIVPDFTFVATAAAVVHAGATPVLVDVEPNTWCIDPELVEAAITPRTRAIIPVHLYGHPADMTAINEIAKRHRLFVLEDAAQAHGARWKGSLVGGLGDAASFSFYGNKLVTTGEGGAISTNDAELDQRIRFLRDHAMAPERRYFHPEVGFNYRLTNLQAALGCAQLRRFDETLLVKERLLACYQASLGPELLTLNPRHPDAVPVVWLVVGLLGERASTAELEDLGRRLRETHRIDTRPFFVPLHQLPPYSSATLHRRDASVATGLAERGLCLPSGSQLQPDDVARVARALEQELA